MLSPVTVIISRSLRGTYLIPQVKVTMKVIKLRGTYVLSPVTSI